MGGLEGGGSIQLYTLSPQLHAYHMVGIQHILTEVSGTIKIGPWAFESDNFHFKTICSVFDHTTEEKPKQERKQNKTLKTDIGPKQANVDIYMLIDPKSITESWHNIKA